MSSLDETRRKPRPVAYEPEYGDAKDVRVVFGLRETTLYGLFYAGKIKGILVPGPKRRRGKRLFSFDSIREYLDQCAEKEEAAK